MNVVNWEPARPWTLNIAFTWAGRFSGVPVRRNSKLAQRLSDQSPSGGQLGVADLPPWFYEQTSPIPAYNMAMDTFIKPPNQPPHPFMLADAADGRLGVSSTPPYVGCATEASSFWAGYDIASQLYSRDYVVANRGFHVSLQPHDWQSPSPFGAFLRQYFAHPGGFGTAIGFPAFEAAYSSQSWARCEPNKMNIPYDGAYTEWSGVQHISQNRYAYEVGAQGPANASVLAHWPMGERYQQPWVSYVNPEQWSADPALLSYATIVVGDYDSADWFAWDLNEKFKAEVPDPQVPVGWSVSPLIAGRVPLDLDWLLSNIKRGSTLLGSNTGVGYVNPDFLPASNRGEWLDAMLAINKRLGTNIMGYALNGHARTISNDSIEKLATAFPGGVITDWQYSQGNSPGSAPTYNKGHNFTDGQLVAGISPVLTQAFNFDGQLIDPNVMSACNGTQAGCVVRLANSILQSIQTGQAAYVTRRDNQKAWFGIARPIPFQVIHANRVSAAALKQLSDELRDKHILVVSPVEFFARLSAS